MCRSCLSFCSNRRGGQSSLKYQQTRRYQEAPLSMQSTLMETKAEDYHFPGSSKTRYGYDLHLPK
jgi:hypothetical protein